LGVQYVYKIFFTSVLLLVYKHRHLLTNVKHNYNTRYKFNINIVSSSNTTFGSQFTLMVGSNLCEKLNINLFNFKSTKEFKFFLYKIDLSNIWTNVYICLNFLFFFLLICNSVTNIFLFLTCYDIITCIPNL
jgi:hypothetical protein